MNMHSFIFSNGFPQRYYRHVAFWCLRFLFLLQSIASGTYAFMSKSVWESLAIGFRLASYIVAAEVAFTMLVVYWLIPRFFRRNNSLFILGIVLFSALLSIVLSPAYIEWMLLNKLPHNPVVLMWECFILTTSWSHPICILFITVSLYKKHLQKVHERTELVRENAKAEMQLLKAQVHPHFLFNTLNNIYSFALNKQRGSARLLEKLTNIFKYMTENFERETISLDHE